MEEVENHYIAEVEDNVIVFLKLLCTFFLYIFEWYFTMVRLIPKDNEE